MSETKGTTLLCCEGRSVFAVLNIDGKTYCAAMKIPDDIKHMGEVRTRLEIFMSDLLSKHWKDLIDKDLL